METFFTILILLLTVSLSGVVTRIFPFQIPLPLMQIIVGAVLAWPQFGLHIDFNPELFLMLFIPRCCSPTVGKRRRKSSSITAEKSFAWPWCW